MALWTIALFIALTFTSMPLVIASKPTTTTARPSKGMEGRVIGGAASRQNQFPYLIAIGNEAKRPGSGNLICGGSLIKENLVLTAAHCFFNSGAKIWMPDLSFTFVGGEHSYRRIEATEQHAGLGKIVFHKDYEPWAIVNDIALVQLTKPFHLNEAVKTIQLATPESKYRESNCTLAGWGTTGESFPDTPRFVQLDIIRKDECAKLYVHKVAASHETTMCVGKIDMTGGQGSCYGDSGGPLVCPSQPAGEPLVVGIVSGNLGCALPNSATTYTNVAFMASWIKKAEAKLETTNESVIWL